MRFWEQPLNISLKVAPKIVMLWILVTFTSKLVVSVFISNSMPIIQGQLIKAGASIFFILVCVHFFGFDSSRCPQRPLLVTLKKYQEQKVELEIFWLKICHEKKFDLRNICSSPNTSESIKSNQEKSKTFWSHYLHK